MIFQRYELKYLLTRSQKISVLEAMEPYMSLDQYGRTVIRNIYFDTRNYRLIRRSLEQPAYKEKLRLRSYRNSSSEDPVFVELKKKYRSVVYKRRILLPQEQAMKFITSNERNMPVHSQIAEEINYFCTYYKDLMPSVFLSYEREAFYDKNGSDFRITFDENILSRQEAFSFSEGIFGEPLLEKGASLMEIKTSGGIPLWMTRCLTKNKIYKTSFSKYGTAYQQTILNNLQGGILRA